MTFILSPNAGLRFVRQLEPFYTQEFHNNKFNEAVGGMRRNWVWRVLYWYGAIVPGLL
ncbi:hypothetical protein GPL17_06390 [Bradyrhizobium yuanmingense]|uniref:hypothetical protein n=1 Tax=Bradyrhizobium yuanmingense TaxID=108015 RepID=UPI0012FC6D2C|nr:hypothetical protein [Bradyrhizobium yuanmingense]MVT50116.1 hypothetical protein [Bradyrhizobium yuanmingense]